MNNKYEIIIILKIINMNNKIVLAAGDKIRQSFSEKLLTKSYLIFIQFVNTANFVVA